MKKLLWLCLIVFPGILIAQADDLRPAALIYQAADMISQQSIQTPFTRLNDNAKNKPALQQYELLALEEESYQSLRFQTASHLRLQLPLPNQSSLELQVIEVEAPQPTVLTSSGEPAGEISTGRHFRGIIAGEPGSLVALSILDEGIQAVISSPTLGGNWVLGPRQNVTKDAETTRTEYVFYQDQEIFEDQAFSCATPDSGVGYAVEELREAVSGGRSLDNCVQVYFEVNYDIFQDKGSVAASVQYVTALANQVATLYANEQVNLTVSEIMVWDTPSPYTSTSSGEMLTVFQSTRTSFNGDLAQLLSYRASGGIAVVDGLCHPYNLAKMSYAGIGSSYREVPTYSWSVMVVAHELGHLLGSQHTHACVWNGNNTALDGCPGYTEGNCGNPGLPSNGGSIMSYCHLSQAGINLSNGFGPQPGALIRNRVSAATCLTACSNPGGGNGGDTGGNGGNPPATSCSGEEVILRLQLDTYSPETSWVLLDAQQAIIAQGGPYPKTVANQVLLDTFCLAEGCYTFQINDSYNDGICCDYGQGSYRLTSAEQGLLAAGGEFPNQENASFCIAGDEPNPPADCQLINFNEMPVVSYGGAQDIGQYSIQDDGQTLYIANNAWKAVMLDYEITRNTVIAFDFKSTRQGEIHGIGFDDNDNISFGYTARVYGTQAWGISNYANYPGNNGWKSYAIPIGQHYVGQANRLFFATDHDGGTRDGNSWFRNVRIYESTDCFADTPAAAALMVPTGLELSVYPNPATNNQTNLRVSTSATGSGQWEIISMTGQVLRSGTQEITGPVIEIPLKLNTLPKSSYLLRWRDAQDEQTVRLVVGKN